MTYTTQATLYDLMAHDMYVWMKKEPKGYTLHIENEDGDVLVNENAINECAIDSFADFCKDFLKRYEKINGVEQ